MEQLKPWTAIFPLNEEYYIALKENLSKQTLPIIRLKSRKDQQDGHPTLLASMPWEKYTCKEVTNLYLDFDIDEPSHKDFTLQQQAERDRNRGLRAVFYDIVTLKIPYELETERIYYEVDFKLSRTPKNSETRKHIQEEIRFLKKNHGIYSEVSNRDKKYYKRIFQNPSCLEISQIRKVANPFMQLRNDLLNGITEESQRFMANLVHTTKNIVWDAYKKFDTQSGYVLDGLISSSIIQRRLKEASV